VSPIEDIADTIDERIVRIALSLREISALVGLEELHLDKNRWRV
jgi:hypothetical protein